jgi:Pvc16 N-terminal domain
VKLLLSTQVVNGSLQRPMLDLALKFLTNEINTYLHMQTGSDSIKVEMSRIVDESGKYAFAEETIGTTIINIEEERIFKSQLPDYIHTNGQHVVLEPELKLNLYILFAANFKLYDQALKFISYILTFFQAHSTFVSTQYPELDPRIGKLNVELQSLNFEQLNQVWAFIGGKQLPSVIYKVRMIALQDKTQTEVQPPLTVVETIIYG